MTKFLLETINLKKSYEHRNGTINLFDNVNIKIKSGATNNRALIFCCRRERFRLFFNGVPSADKSTFVEELLTIKVSFSLYCIK